MLIHEGAEKSEDVSGRGNVHPQRKREMEEGNFHDDGRDIPQSTQQRVGMGNRCTNDQKGKVKCVCKEQPSTIWRKAIGSKEGGKQKKLEKTTARITTSKGSNMEKHPPHR